MPPKTHSLLRPISPLAHQSSIPRSRTLGMLSTLANTFSRSNHSLHNTKSAINLAPARSPIVSIVATSSPPVATFTTNIRQISTAQESGYWCGRFQSLTSRFQQERLEDAVNDPRIMARYVCKQCPESPILKTFASKFNFRKSKKDDDEWENKQAWERKSQDEVDKLMEKEEEHRNLKALRHLEASCATTEAKESFWQWQLSYARTDARHKMYLPKGGRMSDGDQVNWASRMFGGTPAGSPTPSVGRGGFGAIKKTTSMLTLRQQSQAQVAQQSRSIIPVQPAAPTHGSDYSQPASAAHVKHIPLQVGHPGMRALPRQLTMTG